MKTSGMLLVPLLVLALVACSSPEPTADIPATVEATVTAQVQGQIASSLTVTPAPPATARVERVSLQAFTPTPAPPFEPGIGEQVIAISQLQDDAFWQSKEPFWLVGCHIPIWVKKTTLRSSLKPFSNSGTFDQTDSVAMVEGGWASELASTLRGGSMTCLAMRVRYTRSVQYQYCFNLSPVFSDCPQKDEVTIPEFKAAGSLKDWAQLVPTKTVRAYADAPTPTPMPTATAEPLPTNTPIPTVAPTATPHPLLLEFPKERILPVGKLDDTTEIWQDGEPILLLGCYTDIEGGHFISDTGGVGVNTLIAVVRGHFTDEEAMHQNCFALRVQYLALEEYCFWTDHGDLQLNPFLFGGSCPGHLQSTPEFGLSRKAGIEAKVSIMRTDMYPYE